MRFEHFPLEQCFNWCLLKSTHCLSSYHRHPQLLSFSAAETVLYFSSREKSVTLCSISDLRVTEEDMAVRTESSSVDVQGNPFIDLRLQSLRAG